MIRKRFKKHKKKSYKTSSLRRDYKPKQFGKPKVSRPSRTYYLKKNQKRKKIALICSTVLLLVGLFYFLFYSPVFRIREIKIERQETAYSDISNDRLISFVEPFLHAPRIVVFPGDNLFFFNKAVAEQIVRKSLVIDKLKISKGLENVAKIGTSDKRLGKISIMVEDKLPKAVLVSHDRYYYLSADGLVVRQILPDKADKILPLIYDNRNKKIELREKALDGAKVSFMSILSSRFFEKFGGGIWISSYEVSEPENSDIVATTSEGWKIYFDENSEIDDQLKNLGSVLREKIGNQRESLEYVDVRLGNRVFYK